MEANWSETLGGTSRSRSGKEVLWRSRGVDCAAAWSVASGQPRGWY